MIYLKGLLDIEYVIANPYNFYNTFPGDVVEIRVRSDSSAMIAYLSGNSDDKVQGSRSMTQMEAILEAHSFGDLHGC